MVDPALQVPAVDRTEGELLEHLVKGTPATGNLPDERFARSGQHVGQMLVPLDDPPEVPLGGFAAVDAGDLLKLVQHHPDRNSALAGKVVYGVQYLPQGGVLFVNWSGAVPETERRKSPAGASIGVESNF